MSHPAYLTAMFLPVLKSITSVQELYPHNHLKSQHPWQPGLLADLFARRDTINGRLVSTALGIEHAGCANKGLENG